MSSAEFEQIKNRMIRHIERAVGYCKNVSHDDFFQNQMMQEACIFNVLQRRACS